MGALVASFERESGAVAAGATGSLALASAFTPDPGAVVVVWWHGGNHLFAPTGPPPSSGGITWRQIAASVVSSTTSLFCWVGTAPDAPQAVNPSVPYKNNGSTTSGAHLVVQEFGGVKLPPTPNIVVAGPITTSTTGGATASIAPQSEDSIIAWGGADWNGYSSTPTVATDDVLSQSYLYSASGVLAAWTYHRPTINRGARTFGFSAFSTSQTRKIMLAALELPTTPTGARSHRLLADDSSTATYTDSTGRSQGLAFTVDEAGWITRVWWRRSSGVAWPTTATVWQDSSATTGTELVSGVTWPADTTLTGWVPGILTTPVYCVPGVNYRATVTAVGTLPGTTNYWTSGAGASGRRSGPVRAPARASAVNNAQGCYATGSTKAFPATASAGTNYGVDVSFEHDPDFIQGDNDSANPECANNATGWVGSGSAAGVSGGRVTGLTGMDAPTGYRTLNGSAAGWQYVIADARPVSPGEKVSVRAQARPSSAVSVAWYLRFLDSSGATLQDVLGPSASIAAGGQAARTVQGVAPAGAASYCVFTVTGTLAATVSMPANGSLTMTGVRYRHGTWYDVPPLDGDSPKWGWDGAAGNSTSRRVRRVWDADTDGTTATATGLDIGFEGTQTQSTADAGPVNTATGIPVEAAPGGRPGRAVKHYVPADGVRLEHNPWHRSFVDGDDYWFGFAFYLEDDYPLDLDDFQVLEQLHGAPDTGSPVIGFEARNGQLRVRGGDNRPTAGGGNSGSTYAYDRVVVSGLQKQRWYHVIYALRFTEALAGSTVYVWVNNGQADAAFDSFVPPCGTVYGVAEFGATGGSTYRKSGYYKRGSAGRSGTVRLAGHALGTGVYGSTAQLMAAVDPYRTPTTATYAAAAALASGSLVAAGGPSLTQACAAALASGSALGGGAWQTSQAAAALASGTTVGGDAPASRAAAAALASGTALALAGLTTRQAAAVLASGTALRAALLVPGAAVLASGTVVTPDGAVYSGAVASLASGSMIYVGGEITPAARALLASGSLVTVAGYAGRPAAAILASGTVLGADGARAALAAALLASGTSVDAGGVGVRAAAAALQSGSSLELAGATVRAAAAILASGTVLGARAEGPTYLLSGTALTAGTRQTATAAAALASGTSLQLSTVIAWGSARLTSGSMLVAGGYAARAAAAGLSSGSALLVGALGPQRFLATVLASGTSLELAGFAVRDIVLRLVSGTMLYANAEGYSPVFVPPAGPRVPSTPVTRLRFLLADTVTGRIVAELPHLALAWSTPLNKVGSWSATLPVEGILDGFADSGQHDPRAALRGFLTGPYRFSGVVAYGAQALAAGPLLPTDDEDDQMVRIGGATIERMFEKRVNYRPDVGLGEPGDARRDYILSNTNPRAAVYWIVGLAHAQAGNPQRDFPITCTAPPTSLLGEETFTYRSVDQVKAWKSLSDLTSRADGPDVRFVPQINTYPSGSYVTWDLQIGDPTFDVGGGPPGNGSPLPWVWDDVTSTIKRSVDALGMATKVFSAGGGQDRDKAVAIAESDALTRLGFPVLEETDTVPGSDADLRTTQARAGAVLAARGAPTDGWKVTTPVDGLPRLGTYWPGDVARLEIAHKLMIEPGTYLRRITEISGSSDDKVTITCDYEDTLTGSAT